MTTSETHATLPRRPRLLPGLPLLWRAPDTAQLGVDPARAAVISGLSPGQAGVLRELDGRHTVAELVRQGAAGGSSPREVTELLTLLARGGLVEDAMAPPSAAPTVLPPRLAPDLVAWTLRTGRPGRAALAERAETTVVVHGDGRLAVAVATMLAAAGVGRVHVLAEGNVHPEDTGCGYLDEDIGRERGLAAVDAVCRAAPGVRASRTPPARPYELAVLADAVVPDPRLVRRLTRAAVPHLLVRVRDGTGVVGPLVLPGRTSCVTCHDLIRADHDPRWPALAAQLSGRAQPVDLGCAMATAGLAVSQALLALGWRHAGAVPPATVDGTLELDPARATVVRRSWHRHPDCPCWRVRG
ncbi:ThiF family adenylyltransferase [Streptoalloteichus hindustanus]|uniref:Bacteriocin biosynthesis cyclodehydratase domain-containing protein n=1 Tax=Streptoalloteichus hindustanus TaxID=2017 RepID=A0A1M5JB64_STRHI|nr:ThiF family adenylyltransferase [Streptoalloteichus hindustanus]SHG37615.1 bacteriocin biosynthesis cyclodehydratase domain-containing protein [Streptoalloteichus hindustanus]